ncbi:MAG TPA: sodium:solute symporter family protein [Cellvibrionaceae bacterium]
MNTTLFLTALILYILALIGLGWFASKRNKSGEDFLLAGRGLPIFLTIGTTVATMVGTGSSMGAVGFGYANGWGGILYGVGGALGILLLGLLFAPVRQLRFMTMSEELSYYVGASRLIKNTVAVLIFFACIGWLGAHILGGGLYLAWIAGIDLQLAKILIATGFAVYVIIGGYHAVVWTDTVQAIILFAGFILMAALAVHQVGGWEVLMAAQPDSNRSFLALDAIGGLHAASLVCVIMVGVLATPSFRQRIYSGKSVSAVRKSFYISGSLYMLFAAIPAVIGMAAYALNPELDNRNFAFPFLAVEVLPLSVGVLVLIAGLSATMSSASSDAIAGVTVLLRDLFVWVTGRMPAPQQVILYSRISLIAVVFIALTLALLSDDIIAYITGMIATVMSGMFVCALLGRFWPRFNWQGALATLAAGSVISLIVLRYAQGFWGNPILPAVGAALVAGISFSLLTPASSITPEQSLKILDDERKQMENTPLN